MGATSWLPSPRRWNSGRTESVTRYQCGSDGCACSKLAPHRAKARNPEHHTDESAGRGVAFDDVALTSLTDDVVLLTYTATARWNYEQTPNKNLCSTVFVRKGEDWRVALHQQTHHPSENGA